MIMISCYIDFYRWKMALTPSKNYSKSQFTIPVNYGERESSFLESVHHLQTLCTSSKARIKLSAVIAAVKLPSVISKILPR